MFTKYYTNSLRAYSKTLSKPKYIVETRMVNTWENVFTENEKPLIFATESEAQSEIDDLLSEMPDYLKDDYRIVQIAA
jgi:hypothetical protein